MSVKLNFDAEQIKRAIEDALAVGDRKTAKKLFYKNRNLVGDDFLQQKDRQMRRSIASIIAQKINDAGDDLGKLFDVKMELKDYKKSLRTKIYDRLLERIESEQEKAGYTEFFNLIKRENNPAVWREKMRLLCDRDLLRDEMILNEIYRVSGVKIINALKVGREKYKVAKNFLEELEKEVLRGSLIQPLRNVIEEYILSRVPYALFEKQPAFLKEMHEYGFLQDRTYYDQMRRHEEMREEREKRRQESIAREEEMRKERERQRQERAERERKIKEAKQRILELLFEYDFIEAAQEYREVRKIISARWFEINCKEYQKKFLQEKVKDKIEGLQELLRRKVKNEIIGLLRNFDFPQVDVWAKRMCKPYGIDVIEEEWLKNEKVSAAKRWFKLSVRRIDENGEEKEIPIDDEQAAAIVDVHKNTIVSARAGSGKTSTLVAKIVFLIAIYGMKPEEILCFVFNKDAAEEVNKRLKLMMVNGIPLLKDDTDTGGGELRKAGEVATTFHAFSSRIVQKLCGEVEENEHILSNERERLEYIQKIIEEIPKEEIYKFFRSESMELKRGDFDSDEEYEEAQKHTSYTTLDLHTVKSKDEKIISDFLFERGIEYTYEIEYYLSRMRDICRDEKKSKLWELKNKFDQDSIKCDFYLPEYGLVWEHWGITGNETSDQIEKINKSKRIGKYEDYKAKMEWKQWFYQKEWIDEKKMGALGKSQASKYRFYNFENLIETNYQQRRDRERFERELEEKLERLGVKCEKIPQDKILQKIYEKQIKRFTGMVEQFISRAMKQYFDDLGRLERDIWNSNIEDPRVRTFMKIGMECCRKYVWYMKEKREIIPGRIYVTDFDLLVYRAMQIIVSGRNSFLQEFLSQVKFILVDEYQDFSRLFLGLILKIRELCKDAKLFVVGDDWQAINRFAGSDVKYFKDFKRYFSEDEAELEISTNYRSDGCIVELARGFVAKALEENSEFRAKSGNKGKTKLLNPNDTPMEMRANHDNHVEKIYGKWLRHEMRNATRNINDEIRYAKTLGHLLADIFENNKETKDVFVLHRNNDTSFYLENYKFLKAVKNAMLELKMITLENAAKIKVKTIHGAKGLEADVAIILEADDGVLPMYHQDTLLYQIFGENTRTELDDQKRLFYVAMTRAKHKLYILHKKPRQNQRQQQETGADVEDENPGFIKYLDFSALEEENLDKEGDNQALARFI